MTDISVKHKAQSAMEYLMTYGWAILIIAVVLAALFALGVFNGNNLTSNACQASPGYLCSKASYSHSDANVLVTLGQETGTNWVSANFVFVPSGTAYVAGVPAISFTAGPANAVLAGSGMNSGGEQALVLPVNSIMSPINVGTPVVGTIWVQYSYYSSSGGIVKLLGPSYAQIAAVNLKAT